ncbi:GerAB/ArcD/ProY family transporter [Paenibacillus tianmuensis]|nr:endospore germination permease [Paenibacillus tianmuensis]
MHRKEQISPRQFTILVALYTMGDAILYLPAHFTVDAERDVWIASILSVLQMLAVAFLYARLAVRYPGVPFLDYMESVPGRWVGKVLLLYFAAFCFIDVCLLLMEVGDFMSSQVFPRTPVYVILALFMFILVIAVRLGVEATARTSEIVFPGIVVLFLLMMIALSPNIDLDHVQPVLARGFFPVVKASRVLVSFYLDAFVLLLFFPLVQEPKAAVRSLYTGTVIGGGSIILISTIAILVLGADTVLRNAYPTYRLAKKISIVNILERFEIVVTVIWLTTLYFKAYLFLTATTQGFAKLCRIRDHRVIVLPIGFVMVLLGRVINPNRTFMDEWSMKYWMSYSIPFGIGIPVFLLLAGWLRTKGMKPNHS